MTKFVYLDEAGISSPQHEPYTVVAGVIIDPDNLWKDLAIYYRNLAGVTFPDLNDRKFIFEAKQIWDGSGKFKRKKWTLNQRMILLRQLAQVPGLYKTTIVKGVIDREALRKAFLEKVPDITEKQIRFWTYAYAFLIAINDIDAWMKKNAPNEVAILIAEDTQNVKNGIRMLHEGYTEIDGQHEGIFSTTNIVEPVFFVKKNESVLVQMADHCAFIIKRTVMKSKEFYELYKLLKPQIFEDNKNIENLKLRAYLPTKNYSEFDSAVEIFNYKMMYSPEEK